MYCQNKSFGFLAWLLIAFLAPALSWGATEDKTVSFAKDVKPIFDKHCVYCHGPEEEEGFRIDNRDDTLNYIVAGDPDGSDFYEHLISEDEEMLMPPADAENPLSEEQILLVKTWIAEGADWPTVVVADVPVAPLEPKAPAGPKEVTTQVALNATGSLHPAAIHLPIGLLLASGLFAFLSLRGNFVMSDCAYYCLWIGALGAIVACVTGWFYSPMEHRGDVAQLADLLDQTQPVFWHRIAALGASVFALFLAMLAAGSRARDPEDGVLWKLGVIVLAGVIGWVGHLGGELTYGKKHYEDVHTIIGAAIPGWNDGDGAAADVAPAADEDEAAESSDDEADAEPADDDASDLQDAPE